MTTPHGRTPATDLLTYMLALRRLIQFCLSDDRGIPPEATRSPHSEPDRESVVSEYEGGEDPPEVPTTADEAQIVREVMFRDGNGRMRVVCIHGAVPCLTKGCHGCKDYFGQTYGGNQLVCAIHPFGPEEGPCPDRREKDGGEVDLFASRGL